MSGMIAPVGTYVPAQNTRRPRRAEPIARAGDRRGDGGGRALVPAGPRRDADENFAPTGGADASAAVVCAAAALYVQTMQAGRRGLRAEDSEKRRYKQAYDAAARLAPAAAPEWERCA